MALGQQGDDPMRQQVKATVALTFDADASLSADELRDAIAAELRKLVHPFDLGNAVELVGADIITMTEEAAIYSAEGADNAD